MRARARPGDRARRDAAGEGGAAARSNRAGRRPSLDRQYAVHVRRFRPGARASRARDLACTGEWPEPVPSLRGDPRIAAQLVLAWDLWILGYPGRALDNVQQALEQATQRADPYTIAFAHYVTSAVRLLRGEPQDSLEHADRSLAVSNGASNRPLCALLAIRSRLRAHEDRARESTGSPRSAGGSRTRRAATSDICAASCSAGSRSRRARPAITESALLTIEGASQHIDDIAGRAWEAELRRLRGTILLAARPEATDDVERSYRDAIAVAQRQSARSFELRAATALARLLCGRAGRMRRAGCLARSSAGSRRGSIPPTSVREKQSSRGWLDRARFARLSGWPGFHSGVGRESAEPCNFGGIRSTRLGGRASRD